MSEGNVDYSMCGEEFCKWINKDFAWIGQELNLEDFEIALFKHHLHHSFCKLFPTICLADDVMMDD